MALYKRDDIYHIDISIDGRRVRESTGTSIKRDALQYHDSRKSELWRLIKTKEKPRYTWQQASIRWINEHQHKKSIDHDRRRLRILDRWLRGKYLDEITKDLIDQIKWQRAEEFKRDCTGETTDKKVTPAEVNRMLAVLRSILRAACDDWEAVERVPKITLFKEAKKRIRYLTHDEALCLHNNLPQHLQPIFRFSLVTGLREQNVLKLRWSQVDLHTRTIRIEGDETKNSRALRIPINDSALAVLNEVSGINVEYVFVHRGKPLYRANNKSWRKALKESGIEDFKWHDIRHTWASWLVQAGTSLYVLQELGGWESIEMVQRYAHLAPSTLLDAANLNKGLTLNEHITDQDSENAAQKITTSLPEQNHTPELLQHKSKDFEHEPKRYD